MTNITQFTKDGQVLISERELTRLLEFVDEAGKALDDVYALCESIHCKAGENTLIKTLAHIALEKANQWEDGCLCFDNVQLFDKIKQEKLGVAA